MATTAQVATTFDWGQFLNVALPVIFTTAATVAGLIFGQRKGTKATATAMDHTANALVLAQQLVSASLQIAEAAKAASGSAQVSTDNGSEQGGSDAG